MTRLEQSIIAPDPGSFDLSPGDPMYYTEYLSWTIHQNLYALKNAGFQFRQAEQMIAETNETGFENSVNVMTDGFIIPPSGPSQSWLQYLQSDGDVSDVFPTAIWGAQNTYLEGEISYLTQMNKEWKLTEDDVDGGVLDDIWDVITETLEEMLSLGVFKLLAKYKIALTGGQAAVAGILVSLLAKFGFEKIKDAFVQWIKEGNKLLEAMIDEDNALLTAVSSLAAYTYRNEVINRHNETIFRLLDELDKFRQQAEQATGQGGTSDSISEGTDDDADTEAWASVADGISDSIVEIETWLDQIDTQDEENLPMPVPPGLPAPPSSNKLIALKIAYMVGKFGVKFLTELMRQRRENDKAFVDLVEAVDDLKFNGARIHTASGDIIELTGIGTFAESYNS